MLNQIHRLPEVLRARARSRTAHYSDIKNGLYTRPIKIGSRATGWPYSEVCALNAARIAGKSDDEIRNLVIKLESDRNNMNGGI